jgi:hypothetical protein
MTIKDRITYIEETLLGTRVSKKQGNERQEVCRKCELKEKSILGNKCGVCGCFLSVMPLFDTHILKGSTDGVFHKVECGHPNGSKWIDIDKEYKQ